MSQHQIGWIRSYRQALELLIRMQVERKLDFLNTRGAAMAQLEFTARLYSLSGVVEVKADMQLFREQNPEWVKQLNT